MRPVGFVLILLGLGLGGFAAMLAVYLLSGHSGSAMRKAGLRIASWVADENSDSVLTVFRNVAEAFTWLELSLAVNLLASLTSLVLGVWLWSSRASAPSTREI